MIEVDEATWRPGYEKRLRDWYGACSEVREWVDHFVALRLSRWDSQPDRHVFEVDGGFGALAVLEPPGGVQLVECPTESALDEVLGWASDRAARLAVTLPPGAPDFFERLPRRATGMLKTLVEKPQVDGVSARPMAESEYEPWLQGQLAEYVGEMVDSGTFGADDAWDRARVQFQEFLPDGVHTAAQSILCLEAAGEVVGTNWLSHGYQPRTSWVQGVDIRPEHRGKGYGRAAMLWGEIASIEAGDAQLGLNVFEHNQVAARLYESLGYRPVEVFRSIELPYASGRVPAGDQRRGE